MEALALDVDRLYVGGEFTRIGGSLRSPNFAILDKTSGVPQPGPSANEGVFTIAQNDESLFFGGAFSWYGVYSGGLALLSETDDLPDVDFPVSPVEARKDFQVVIPDGAGGWYVGGRFDHLNDEDYHFWCVRSEA